MDRPHPSSILSKIPHKYYELFRLVYYGEMHSKHLRRKWYNDDKQYWQYSEFIDSDHEDFPYKQLNERFHVITKFFDSNFFDTKEKIFFLDILQPFIDDYYGDDKKRFINSINKFENDMGPIHPAHLRLLNSEKENLEIHLKFEDAYKKLFTEYRASLTKKKNTIKHIIPKSFEELTNPENLKFILQMLEDLQITKNGKYILGDRKKSSIRGVVEALRQEIIIPNITLEASCNLIASRIELQLNSKLDHSDIVKSYKKLALDYIKNHYKRS
jgi:hypothetical protein